MRYLQSRANFSGSFCALMVLVGHLFNFIGPGWWYLALGAYVGGSLPFLFGQPKPQLTHETSTA
ncbi:MAG: hypothetical protein RL748_182, partial [Pseudomonadota bacterium]